MKRINVNAIRIDGGTQSRAELHNATVDEYCEAMQAGDEFPPVTVFFDGSDYWLADGFHRYLAIKRAGKTSLDCEVHNGDQRAAILHSWKANDKHGLRRSTADKRRIVSAILADAEHAKWSSRHIGKEYGFSHVFVESMRSHVETFPHAQPENTRKAERNGVVFDHRVPKKEAHVETFPHAEDADKAEEADFVERIGQENIELRERLEATTADDLARKVNDQQTEIYGLRGRIQQMLAAAKSMESQQKYNSDFVHKLRKMLGVTTHQEILDAVAAMRAEA